MLFADFNIEDSAKLKMCYVVLEIFANNDLGQIYK